MEPPTLAAVMLAYGAAANLPCIAIQRYNRARIARIEARGTGGRMTPLAVVLATIVVMEPAVALTHRFVMHGAGWAWHRSHHQPPRARFEANDLFPVVFAAVTVGVMAVGSC